MGFIRRRVGVARVRMYGRMGPLEQQQREAIHRGLSLGATRLCSVLPAGQGHENAWHKVVEFCPGDVVYGEAIVLREENTGAIFTSRDCPIVTAVDERSSLVGVAYAGRRSLMKTGAECPSCDTGVLENLFAAMGNPYGEHLLVYVTGGISAKNFPHDDPAIVRPFIEKFGADVVADHRRGTLDLFRVIRKICIRYGVKKDRIFQDGICTFEAEWTGSRRAGRSGSNWTYVIKTR